MTTISAPRRAVSPRGLVYVLVAALASAGCTAGGPQSTHDLELSGDVAYITGVVVDDELVPLENVTLIADPSGRTAYTGPAGRFTLGPLEYGDYAITAEKKGYSSATTRVFLNGDDTPPVTLGLIPLALDVPYHHTQRHVTFVYCATYNPIGGIPCTDLPDYVLNTNLTTEETFRFTFRIPNPGLVDMLVEMTWTSQAFGRDMLFMVQTPPGQPATALSTKYFSKAGGSPLRGWVEAGIKNRCGSGECAGLFDGEQNKILYEGVTVWSDGNATIPPVYNPTNNQKILSGVSVYLNHRTEVWLTMFHNRAGSRSFTALADG